MSINIIKSIFDEHVSNKGFNPTYIRCTNSEFGAKAPNQNLFPFEFKRSNSENRNYAWGCEVINPTTLITYKFDGVEIIYDKRVRTYLGDCDLFTEITVKIDGEVTYNKIS